MVYLLFYYRALGMVAVVSLIPRRDHHLLRLCHPRATSRTGTDTGRRGRCDRRHRYHRRPSWSTSERIRDEIREGRSLRAACDAGKARARSTILAADFVSFLAAVILYFYLSVGAVRGFAFVLGLTTLIDVMVAFIFTRPMVSVLAQHRGSQRSPADRSGSAALGRHVHARPDIVAPRTRWRSDVQIR